MQDKLMPEDNKSMSNEIFNGVITPIVGVDWVHVSEQLPDYNKRVLIYTADDHIFDLDRNYIRINIGELCKFEPKEEHHKSKYSSGNEKPYFWKAGPRYLDAKNVTHWKLLLAPING
jgi:Protein of unknown function (DUF551)